LGDFIFHYALLCFFYNIFPDISMEGHVMEQALIVSRFTPLSEFCELLTKISGTSATCPTAFMNSSQTNLQVACQVDNVCAELDFFVK
jgi:hypothetical protein